jgi:hypothetical protein
MNTLTNHGQALPIWNLARRRSSVSHALHRLLTRLHMPQGEPPWVENPSPTPPGPKPPPEMPPGRSPDVIEPPIPAEQPPIQEPPSSPGEIVVTAFGAFRLTCAMRSRAQSLAQPTGHAACPSKALSPQRALCLRNHPSTTFRIPT